jgi:hypothetical protein
MPSRKHPHHHHHPPSMPDLVQPERIDALLAPWVPNEEDRAFVLRNILAEGPEHHRITTYTILILLGEVLAATGGDRRGLGPGVDVPMRLPPRRDQRPATFPATLPTRILSRVLPPDRSEDPVVVDALLGGPSHHALANAAMIDLLDRILASLEQ